MAQSGDFAIIMENLDIDRILLKHIREEELTPEEVAFMKVWLRAEGREDLIRNITDETDWMKNELKRMQQTPHSRIWDKFSSRLEEEGYWQTGTTTPVVPMSQHRSNRWRPVAAAAAILFAVAGGFGFWALQRKSAVPTTAPVQSRTPAIADAQPGTNRAVLTLADGRQINLDSSTNGILASQGNMKVTKLADGQLAYNKTSEEKPIVPAYNQLSTPRAGQFSLTLPDGSKVWLNNASSLRYPVAFTGSNREVELTGEAYFEIAKDASHPFRVAVHRGDRSSTIEVLGTSFNIMAYEDEAAERTTLVEGSVRFVHGSTSALLKPNEQSMLDENGSLKTFHHVNVSEITAWKNGYFHFDQASLQSTMRQLARWYDVDVEYAGNIPTREFTGMGKIQRNLPLSTVLQGLENEHLHFTLQGRKLLVRP